MAAVLGAVRALQESGTELAGDLWLTAVVGHEEPEAGKDGPKALIQDINDGRIAADRIIIVEGDDELWVMSMGSMVFTVTLTPSNGGRHTQYVDFKDNPIRFAGDLVAAIAARQDELDTQDVHPLAGAERIEGAEPFLAGAAGVKGAFLFFRGDADGALHGRIAHQTEKPRLMIGAGGRASRRGDGGFHHALRHRLAGELAHRMAAFDLVEKRGGAALHLLVAAGDVIAELGERRECRVGHQSSSA